MTDVLVSRGAPLLGARGEMAVAEAREWIGTPVRWEASLKGVGCDCRGLVSGVARALGWAEGDAFEAGVAGYSRNIREAELVAGLDRLFDPVARSLPAAALLGAARAGDVLAFRIKHKVQHLAICADGGRMIHAYLTTPSQVVEVAISEYWQRRLAGVWRWRDLSGSAAAGEGSGNGR